MKNSVIESDSESLANLLAHDVDVVQRVSTNNLRRHCEDNRNLLRLNSELVETALSKRLLASLIYPVCLDIAIPERNRNAGRAHLNLLRQRLDQRALGHLLENRSRLLRLQEPRKILGSSKIIRRNSHSNSLF